MTKLLCNNQKISPLVKVEEQVFSLLIFFNMADIVGTTVASQRWPASGQPMVGRRWPADVGKQRKCATGSLAVDRWWQFAVYSHWRTDGVMLSGKYHIEARIHVIWTYTRSRVTALVHLYHIAPQNRKQLYIGLVVVL